MLRRILRKVKRNFIGFLIRISYKNDVSQISDKSIFIDLDDIPFERYFYLLVKFFHLDGYTIYFKPNLMALAGLKQSEYSNYLLEEKILFLESKPPNCQIRISNSGDGISLSADYFTDLLHDRLYSDVYYVPMAMHPNMYHEQVWNLEYNFKKKQCVFFAGNFDKEAYLKIKNEQVFNVLDRISIYNVLKRNFEIYIPERFEDSQAREAEKEVVIIDRDYCEVPKQLLRETLSKYDFFLACPGIVMPFSHNIIEAMSVGCIPLIEMEYSKLFIPNLRDGINAVVFEGEEGLKAQIKRIFELDKKKVVQMSANVFDYYSQYLTPKSIAAEIASKKYKKIYLQAEFYSVKLYKRDE